MRTAETRRRGFGVEVLDVAISGSTPPAEEGVLTLLIGGNRELFRAAEPIFQAVARQYVRLGGPGSGTAMKLVVNTLLVLACRPLPRLSSLGRQLV
jgi:3-hydroxyisobutyrate dehydrogenase-like beta-hydroxyacid dehydrogenase